MSEGTDHANLKPCGAGHQMFPVLSSRAFPEDLDGMPVRERVEFLKFQLEEQLQAKAMRQQTADHLADDEQPPVINANYDYVDLSQVPITPINEKDERKLNERYKLRQLATTTKRTTTWSMKSHWPQIKRERVEVSPVDLSPTTTTEVTEKLFNPMSDDNIARIQHREKSKKGKNHHMNPIMAIKSAIQEASIPDKPVEIFYKQRRLLQDEACRDEPLPWTHCQDMITPFLTGMKGELTAPKILGSSHRTVIRLLHLISTNVTNYSKADIYSLMYQISNVQLRFFQWDVPAIKILLNVICKGQKHTYRNIKRGMIALFKSWHLDISNTRNLLNQSRLFRPYCIANSNQGGSTKSSKVTYYTSPEPAVEQRARICEDSDCDNEN